MDRVRSRPRSQLLLTLLMVAFVVVVAVQVLAGGGTTASTPPPDLGFEDPLGANPLAPSPATPTTTGTEVASTTLAPLDPNARRNPFLSPSGVTTSADPTGPSGAPPT